jgi:hypothetical protein
MDEQEDIANLMPEFVPSAAQEMMSEYSVKQEGMKRILELANKLGVDASIYFKESPPTSSITNVQLANAPSSKVLVPADPEAYAAAQNPYA